MAASGREQTFTDHPIQVAQFLRFATPRSLRDLGRIYCGKAGFGQISRSFSLNPLRF